MKHLKKYNESYDISDIRSIVYDVMSDINDSGEFIITVKDGEAFSEDLAIMEITTSDCQLHPEFYRPTGEVTKELEDALVRLDKHLNEYGLKLLTITHISSGKGVYSSIPGYISRMNRLNNVGHLLSGKSFYCPKQFFIRVN